MAEEQNVAAEETEGKVSVTLAQGTRIAGEQYDAGDSVDVYEQEKRHLIAAGIAEGDLEESASANEVAQGNLQEDKGASVTAGEEAPKSSKK